MNLFITNKCIKNCSFCFNKDRVTPTPSYEEIIQLLKKIKPTESISLLGGEPTTHPKFLDIHKYILKKFDRYLLFTNLLTDNEIWKEMWQINYCSPKQSALGLAINCNELSDSNRKIFYRNFNFLVGFKRICFALTIGEETDVNSYDTEFIRNMVKRQRARLRISAAMPHGVEQTFIHNKEIGDKIISIIKKIDVPASYISLDCIITPCLFSKNDWNFIKANFDEKNNFKTSCNGVPFDVMIGEKRIKYCLPCNDISIEIPSTNNIEFGEIRDELREKYLELYKPLCPEKCRECKYRKTDCGGACLAVKRLEMPKYKNINDG